jgi:hypothetical protein
MNCRQVNSLSRHNLSECTFLRQNKIVVIVKDADYCNFIRLQNKFMSQQLELFQYA